MSEQVDTKDPQKQPESPDEKKENGKKQKPKKEKEAPKEPKPKKQKKPKKGFNFRRLLSPLVPVYSFGLALREWAINIGFEPVQSLNWPVISIGNLSTGGTGKTPLTITLAKELTERGCGVDILSRGYGRTSQFPMRVDPEGTAEDFGDEPLLIAREAMVPVFVAAVRHDAGTMAEAQLEPERRAAKAKLERELAAQAQAKAEEEARLLEAGEGQLALPSESVVAEPASTQESRFHGAFNTALARRGERVEQPRKPRNLPPVHLLDDGFQHRQLARAVNVLLMNREDWSGTLLPAGNLREPHRAAHRASVIAIPAKDVELEQAIRTWGWQGPIWKLRRIMDVAPVKEPVAAFCGIANPEQFFEGLKSAKFELVGEYAFPDHYTYTPEVLRELISEARSWGATALLTTQKDMTRLGKLAEMISANIPLTPVKLTTEIEDIESVLDWLEDQLTGSNQVAPQR